MTRRALAFLALVGLAACQGGEGVTSSDDPSIGPSFAISDAGHGGNPDFSFRPPMVPNTTGGSAFNPNLSPSVIICPRNAANTACSGLSVVYPNVGVSGDQYHLNWKVPNSSQVIYRITVVVGTTELGFADVWTAAKAKDLNGVNTNEFVTQVDGSTLPIKFTIGQYAFCETPGVGPCGTETFSLTQGGDVVFTPEGSTEPTGVIIPPQPTGGAVTLTAEPCENFNPRVTDLPTFGKCVTITTDPELPPEGLAVAATVFVCDLNGLEGNVNSHEQAHRVTLHRLDIDEAGTRLEALPHAVGCPPVVASVGGGGLKGFFANLLHGRLGAAGRQVLAVFQPATLHARRLNEGAGGSTDEFSDFQFMLPGKLEKVEGDGQSGAPGSTLPVNPKVRVTDLGGEPIRNARVRWAETAAACRDLPAGSGAPTDVNGHASTSWTLSGTPGANSLAACGRGIAGDDFNGPRDDVVDPFQAFPYLGLPTPESGTPSGPVELKTGSVMFSANGEAEPVSSAFSETGFGSGGYSYKQIGSADDSPDGWELSGFNVFAAGFSVDHDAPFGTPGCSATPPSPWATFTDLLVRKKFSLATAQDIQIKIAVDNDLVDVYLNGVRLNGPTPTSHEGCAVPEAGDNLTFTAPAVAGINTLAIRVRDRGGVAFVDIKISASVSF